MSKVHAEQAARIQRYYLFQSKIYNLTRWSFLFGRQRILRMLPFEYEETFQLLEVGCGTGHNLRRLSRMYPEAQLKGLDVSSDMLNVARKQLPTGKVQLLEMPYQSNFYSWTGKLDAILFSYVLTMINPQWEELIVQAYQDLRPGGVIAVVDFYDTDWRFFERHMSQHHVRMDGHLLPCLQEHFVMEQELVLPAYGGLWHYFKWIGRKQ